MSADAQQQLEQRVTELEIALAFRQRTIDELDEAIRQQAERIDQLERLLTKLITERQRGVEIDSDPTVDPERDDPF